MIQLSVNLPKKYRLDVHLVHQRRETPISQPLFPSLRDIFSIRAGSKFSRFFTHIFSHKYIKKILGANIALAVVASSFMPVKSTFDSETVEYTVREQQILTTTEKGTRYPVEEVKVTNGYQLVHPGVDLDGITGDPIYPVLAGRVKSIQYSRFAYGNAVLVGHGGSLDSLYAHLSKIYVKEGQEVNIKTQLGEMGATGRAFGDHLHFEVHDNGRPISPYLLLPRRK